VKRNDTSFDEIESLIYRLFAEKQFAMALLALVMVANLASAQFLLLRAAKTYAQTVQAPSPSERIDVRCQGGALTDLGGKAIDRAALGSKKVVVHFPAEASACVVQATESGVSELIIGVPSP
jgi:hypothetical protein